MMPRSVPTGLGGWRALATAAGLVLLVGCVILLGATRITIDGTWRGLYLLRGQTSLALELQDDLYLGEAGRLLAGVSFHPVRAWLGLAPPETAVGGLQLDWNEREGRGTVRSDLGAGRVLLTSFGRFQDDDGRRPQGLIVGGSSDDIAADVRGQNQSGVSYFDGHGWIHLWCNVNEALWDLRGGENHSTGSWRFLESRVVEEGRERVLLTSQHEVELLGARLRLEREAHFVAGAPFFDLSVRLIGEGPGPAEVVWVYGDEPWVGNFGSSEGNVGWLEEGLVRFERHVDPVAHRWGGILDEKSGYANYLEWSGQPPSELYFSNGAGRYAPLQAQVPLASNEVFIGLEWRPRALHPGEVAEVTLRIGLADRDPLTGLPARPALAARHPRPRGTDPRPPRAASR
jgi:hypothetical protein